MRVSFCALEDVMTSLLDWHVGVHTSAFLLLDQSVLFSAMLKTYKHVHLLKTAELFVAMIRVNARA